MDPHEYLEQAGLNSCLLTLSDITTLPETISQVNTSKDWGKDKARLRSSFLLQLIELWIRSRHLGEQWAKGEKKLKLDSSSTKHGL